MKPLARIYPPGDPLIWIIGLFNLLITTYLASRHFAVFACDVDVESNNKATLSSGTHILTAPNHDIVLICCGGVKWTYESVPDRMQSYEIQPHPMAQRYNSLRRGLPNMETRPRSAGLGYLPGSADLSQPISYDLAKPMEQLQLPSMSPMWRRSNTAEGIAYSKVIESDLGIGGSMLETSLNNSEDQGMSEIHNVLVMKPDELDEPNTYFGNENKAENLLNLRRARYTNPVSQK
ncbi:unnamed protein product [Protopolystoma xenopodis]|uniref:Uncharacterized protein n=1 Tax=Protopolystoma xenopodis TaxID=117903 RepID=A0A448WK12_9PLAT|nr:unnamed protein product [Protopolystoma xenopodis]